MNQKIGKTSGIWCMFTAPPLKVGMAEGFTPVAEWGWATSEEEIRKEMEGVKKELGRIEEDFNGEVKFEGWDIIHSEDEVLKKSFEVQSSDVDGVLVFPCATTITYTHAFLSFNKPLIFFIKEFSKPFYGGNLLGAHLDWDLCNIKRSHWVSIVSDSYGELSEKIRVVRAISKLKRAKILCMGPLHKYIGGKALRRGSYEVLRKAQEKLGIAVEFVSLEELTKEFEKKEISDEIRESYKEFLSKAKSSEIKDEESALKAVKVYFILKEMIERTKSDVLTISCYQTKLIDEIGTTPCYAIAKLNEEGIVAGCEADFDALINMLITSYVAGKPVFMGDPVFNERVPKIINAHCLCPSKLGGYDKEGEPYIATTHYESGKGLTYQTIMKKGQKITATLLSPDLSAMIIIRGIITNSNMNYPICRAQVEFEISDPEGLWKECELHIPFIGHMINVYGDYTREIAEACRLLGIEPIIT
jgi:hypothetical protein